MKRFRIRPRLRELIARKKEGDLRQLLSKLREPDSNSREAAFAQLCDIAEKSPTDRDAIFKAAGCGGFQSTPVDQCNELRTVPRMRKHSNANSASPDDDFSRDRYHAGAVSPVHSRNSLHALFHHPHICLVPLLDNLSDSKNPMCRLCTSRLGPCKHLVFSNKR